MTAREEVCATSAGVTRTRAAGTITSDGRGRKVLWQTGCNRHIRAGCTPGGSACTSCVNPGLRSPFLIRMFGVVFLPPVRHTSHRTVSPLPIPAVRCSTRPDRGPRKGTRGGTSCGDDPPPAIGISALDVPGRTSRQWTQVGHRVGISNYQTSTTNRKF